jgi:hypothetical protein
MVLHLTTNLGTHDQKHGVLRPRLLLEVLKKSSHGGSTNVVRQAKMTLANMSPRHSIKAPRSSLGLLLLLIITKYSFDIGAERTTDLMTEWEAVDRKASLSL